MPAPNQFSRRGTLLIALLSSGAIPVVSICLGYGATPERNYDPWLGGLTPALVFGFFGALGSVLSLCLSLAVLRCAALGPFPPVLRFVIVMIICGCVCGAAACLGLKTMLERQPAVFP